MIKLERGDKPSELTDDMISKLTEEFKTNKTPVWNKDYIKNALLNFSHSKCCYCETKLKEESKYLTVDHFHHKNTYPDEVVEWDNLLPCCSRCNSKKGTHDTYKIPIINPTKDNPQEHLFFYHCIYFSKDDSLLGNNTIEVLNLNDVDEMLMPRFEISVAIIKELHNIADRLKNYTPTPTDVREQNKILDSITALLNQALPERQYSALVSTTILECYYYTIIKGLLIKFSLWNDELDALENSAKSICLSNNIR